MAIITPPIPADKVPRVDEWLRSVLWESVFPAPSKSSLAIAPPQDFEIHRLKGILVLDDRSCKIIQAVRDVFEIRDAEAAPSGEDSATAQCKVVLIGRGLGSSVDPWQESFESFLA